MLESLWFVLPGLTAGVMTLALMPLMSRLAVWVGAVDLPSERKVHGTPIPRLGGLGVVISIATAFVCAPRISAGRWQMPADVLAGIGCGLLPIVAISLADDIRSVRASYKFLAHLLGALTAVTLGISLAPVVHLFGYEIHIGWMAGPLSIVWILGVTNAFNLIDGLDGLSTGLAFIASTSMAVVFALVGQLGMAGASLVLAGALLGFLPYNMHPARLFLGDTGTAAIGFCLAAFALRGGSTLSSGLAALLPVFILGLPIADTLIAVVRRTLRRLEYHTGSIFDADKNHIHHRLLALGIDHRSAVFVLHGAGLMLAGTALASLLLSARDAALLVVALLCAGLIGVHRLGYDEFALFRRGTVLKVYDLRTVNRGFFIVFVDLALSFIAAYVSVGLKSDLWTFSSVGRPILAVATILGPVTVAVFSWCGMYRGSWRVAGLQDLTRVVMAIVIATVAGGLGVNLLSSDAYPPSLFAIYGIVSLLLTAALRASYVIVEHTTLRSSHNGEPVLIYGAGRRGATAARELLQNQKLNLRPVGFIDDDPAKRGRIVAGLPVLGAGHELENVLTFTGSSCVLVSSDRITTPHIDRATEVCRKVHAKLFHLDLSVHRMDHEESASIPLAPPVATGSPAAREPVPRTLDALACLECQPCPSCSGLHVHRSKARSPLERVKKLRTEKRLYRCEDCGWRGWLTPLEFGTSLGLDTSISFDPRLPDLIGRADAALVPSILDHLSRSGRTPL